MCRPSKGATLEQYEEEEEGKWGKCYQWMFYIDICNSFRFN